MTKELTDEQIRKIICGQNSSGLYGRVRAVIAADRALQDARHAEGLAAYELTVSNLRAAQCTPDIHAIFWQLRSKLLKLPRYSFLLNSGGGVERVSDSCGKWIEADDAAGLCEVESVDAMIAAAPQPPAQPELKPTSVSRSKRAELEAHGYVVNGVALMHPETRQRVLLDYCGFVGWWHGQVHHDQQAQPERKPMTRGQVDDLAEDGMFLRSVYEIVQAVEAFHGIKDAP